MGRIARITAIGLATLGTVAAMTAPASADTGYTAVVPSVGAGGICELTDVDYPAGSHVGVLYGGPLLLIDSTSGLVGSGTLTCRVQANVADHTGTGPSVSGHGTGIVTAGPLPVLYGTGAQDAVFLCAEFTDDAGGMTYYWDDSATAWVTNPHAPCEYPAAE